MTSEGGSPTGTATTRPTSTPTTAFAPAVSSPPAPFTVRAVGRDSSGRERRVTDPRVQTRSGDRRSPLARPAPSQRPHDPHNPGPRPQTWDAWWAFPERVLTPTTPPPHRKPPAAPVPAAGPRCAPPAGNGLRGRQSDRAATTAPAVINPRRLKLDADGERGSHGETGRGSGSAPPPGASTAQPDPVPRPPLHRVSASTEWEGLGGAFAAAVGSVVQRLCL